MAAWCCEDVVATRLVVRVEVAACEAVPVTQGARRRPRRRRRRQHTRRSDARRQVEGADDVVGVARVVRVRGGFGLSVAVAVGIGVVVVVAPHGVRDEVSARLRHVVVLGRTEDDGRQVLELRGGQRDRHRDADEEGRQEDLGEEALPVAARVGEALDHDGVELLRVESVSREAAATLWATDRSVLIT